MRFDNKLCCGNENLVRADKKCMEMDLAEACRVIESWKLVSTDFEAITMTYRSMT